VAFEPFSEPVAVVHSHIPGSDSDIGLSNETGPM
jgi:hypothetical protein